MLSLYTAATLVLIVSSSEMASGRGSDDEQRMLVSEDGSARVEQVTRSLSAYRGHLTRLYNDIETLFPNFESHMAALERKSTLDCRP